MKKKVLVTSGMVLVFLILFYLITGMFLSYNKPIKSPYVLLEGWISHSILEEASNYILVNNIDSVFVFGMSQLNSTVNLQNIDKSGRLNKWGNTYPNMGGLLGFEILSEKLKDKSILTFNMCGTGDIDRFPHYLIFQDERLISTGFAQKYDSCYNFILTKSLTDSVTYLLINFDNDKTSLTGDRNLFISDINIDSVIIDSLIKDYFFIPSFLKPNLNLISKLNSIKYYLNDLGYDSSKVKLVEVKQDSFNKSLAIAEGAKEYFKNTKIKTINIITANKHSSRSYLNFKNCLEDNIDVGCFSVTNERKQKLSFYKGVDERISLLFTWIFWCFH